jgi:hypothetical protein
MGIFLKTAASFPQLPYYFLSKSLAQKMEVKLPCEASVNLYQTTRHHSPEDWRPHWSHLTFPFRLCSYLIWFRKEWYSFRLRHKKADVYFFILFMFYVALHTVYLPFNPWNFLPQFVFNSLHIICQKRRILPPGLYCSTVIIIMFHGANKTSSSCVVE